MSSEAEHAPGRTRIVLSWTPLILLVWLVGVDSLWQLRQGRTLAIPLPFSRPMAPEELADARESAETWFIPAMAFLATSTVVLAARAPGRPGLCCGWGRRSCVA